MLTRIEEPRHAPSAEHTYTLSTTGCLEIPPGYKTGKLVITEAVPAEYFGVQLEGVDVNKLFMSISAALAAEFRAIEMHSGRATTRIHFGGCGRLTMFTNNRVIGTLPITHATFDIALRVCRNAHMKLSDGQIFLTMLLLFGEDLLKEEE